MNYGEYDIRYLKGVGEKTARLYNKLGIFTVDDLIRHYPRKYLDYSNTVFVKDAPPDTPVFIKATMITPVKESMIRKGLTLYKCNFSDGETVIRVTIFNNKYLAKALRTFDDYILYGKVEKTFTSASMSSPQIERADKAEVHPVYPTTEKLSVKAISNSVRNALALVGKIPETLSDDILKKYDLVSLDFATRQIHFPTDEKNIEPARHRLIFDELLTLQLGLLKLKEKDVKGNSCKIKKDFTNEFYSLLPFTPTGAQQRAVADCIEDMQSDRMMNRLIQGDVGSGKTAVAGAVIYTVIKNGAQAALMAPTEILATQHFESFKKLFAFTDVRVALLTGSVKAGEKKEIKRALCNGEIDLIVGTHALIQNDVEFENLGLVCTDEQHRFGVMQRSTLEHKSAHGLKPHTVVMSATPIPRTLAMILYCDLDISVIDELPKGRKPVETYAVGTGMRMRVYRFIAEEVANGHQAYIVCPLAENEDPEDLPDELASAREYADSLRNTPLANTRVAYIHGKMKPSEKDRIMTDFAAHKTDVLVSTTVIEVGVNVPNATVMFIENAERFGLSQLHQLRGRVGRGSDKAYCILLSPLMKKEKKNADSAFAKRMEVLCKTANGFVIAEKDLELRGPGEFFGTRQSGELTFRLADITDTDLVRLADEWAKKTLDSRS